MKKIIGFVLCIGVVASLGFTWGKPNRVAEVCYTESTSDATYTNTVAEVRTLLDTASVFVFDTNEVIIATSHTPVSIGQILLGSTNMWISTGTTTNDWMQIK